MVCKSVLSAITGAFLRKILDFSQKCGCHDLMLKAMNFNDAVIVSVRWNDYRIDFWYMSKDEAINWLRNADLTEKRWNIIKCKNLLSPIKDE